MSAEEIIVVCTPVAKRSRPVLGAVQRQCQACGCGIWVSPSTVKSMLEPRGEIRLQCGDCAIPLILTDPKAELLLTKEQVEEVAAEIARRKAMA